MLLINLYCYFEKLLHNMMNILQYNVIVLYIAYLLCDLIIIILNLVFLMIIIISSEGETRAELVIRNAVV